MAGKNGNSDHLQRAVKHLGRVVQEAEGLYRELGIHCDGNEELMQQHVLQLMQGATLALAAGKEWNAGHGMAMIAMSWFLHEGGPAEELAEMLQVVPNYLDEEVWDALDERVGIADALTREHPDAHDWINPATLQCVITSLAVAQCFMRLAAAGRPHPDHVTGPAVEALTDLVRYKHVGEADQPRELVQLGALEKSINEVIRFSHRCDDPEQHQKIVCDALGYAVAVYDSLQPLAASASDAPGESQNLRKWQATLGAVIAEVSQGAAPDDWREMLDSFKVEQPDVQARPHSPNAR